MSRVGKTPIAIPAGVEVALQPDAIRVKGALGAWRWPPMPKCRCSMPMAA